MRVFSKLALATALASAAMTVAVVPVSAAKEKADKAAKVKPSKGFVAAYVPVSKLVDGGDVAGAKAALPGLEATATTDDDRYILGKLLVSLGGKAQEPAVQLRGLKMSAATSVIPAAEKAQFNYFIGKLSFGQKDYTGSVAALDQARTLGFTGADDLDLIASLSHFELGQSAAGFDALRRAVAAVEAKGQRPDEAWLGRGLTAASKAKNGTEISSWARALVKHYPTPQNWRAALSVYRDGVPSLTPGENLDLMRLMREANAMEGERDFAEYVDAAHPKRLPGEVVSVAEEAVARGKLKPGGYVGEQLIMAKANVAADRAGLTAAERDSKSSGTGRTALATADAFFGYGDYAKAADLYALAMTKGGIDNDVALTRHGIALYKSGNLDGALADFAKVGPGNRKPIADYWAMYINMKQNPPATATAAAPAAASK